MDDEFKTKILSVVGKFEMLLDSLISELEEMKKIPNHVHEPIPEPANEVPVLVSDDNVKSELVSEFEDIAAKVIEKVIFVRP